VGDLTGVGGGSEFGRAEVGEPRAEARVGHDHGEGGDAAVDGARVVVDVLEPLRDVGGDLEAGDPGAERREAGVARATEARRQRGGARRELVREVEVGARGARAQQPREAGVVVPADPGKRGGVHGRGARAARELEKGGVAAPEGAAPVGGGGGGPACALGEEAVGSGGQLLERVEDRRVRERGARRGERGAAGGRGGGGGRRGGAAPLRAGRGRARARARGGAGRPCPRVGRGGGGGGGPGRGGAALGGGGRGGAAGRRASRGLRCQRVGACPGLAHRRPWRR
jgi:hypothetical protein